MAALKNWFEIALPHADIREGRLDESVFAANIWAVRQEAAPTTYLDPEAFFGKTYLTGGLSRILQKVARALTGSADAGDRIISLQTAFGGGKTHTQVALFHLARHPEILRASPACREIRDALGSLIPQERCPTAVFTNQTCDATQGRDTPEGVHTRTLWGELALQLGGVELYRRIEANDQGRAVPQGLFADILRQVAPCLILLDEMADYCVGALAVSVGQATLADQTISFVQQLTEAAAQVPGAVIVATLPASHLEVASSDKGQEILSRLEKRFGRMSAYLKPVSDEEITEVVRRRLFERLGEPADHAQVADAYVKLYQQHKQEVPPEATKAGYREKLLAAYPFHPSLIDTFYLRWGSHNDFQRTRGVLRLLASIVGDLWQQRQTTKQSQPLIQPAHIRWTVDALRASLTRLWGATYHSVVAADVIGDKANAVALDEERGRGYADERVSQGVAAAVLLGSFGGQGERAGFSSKEVRLCVSRPDLNWGYTDGALLALEDRAFYLHNASAGSLGKRYWFGTKPTLTKLLVQYRGQFAGQDFDAEIIDTLLRQVKGLKAEPATWTEIGNSISDHLLAVWRQVTDEEEWVLRKVGSVTLQRTGMVPKEGGIRVKDAVEAFLRYTDKPMISAADAVVQGLSQACKDRVIGIGRGVSPEKLQAKKRGEYVAIDRAEEGVWIIPPFSEEAPPAKGGARQDGGGRSGSVIEGVDDEDATQADRISPPSGTQPAQVTSLTIGGTVAMESWTELFRCFINPAAKLNLKALQLAIEFKLVTQEGHPLPSDHPTLTAMREAAKQLGLRVDEQ